MTKNNHESIFMKNIQRGIDKKIILLSNDESRITYYCSRQFTDNFKDPEEKVRASYFAELVLDYDYLKEKINLEEIKALKIPLPPLSVQNKIAEEVKKRMQKAEQLQKEAKEELEKAKAEVEKIILG